MSLPGQLRFAADDGTVTLSRSARAEFGARVAVLLVPDLFRLDIRPHGDTLEIRVRGLGEAGGRWYTGDQPESWYQAGTAALTPSAESLHIEIGAATIRVTVSSTLTPDGTGMRFLAQATMRGRAA